MCLEAVAASDRCCGCCVKQDELAGVSGEGKGFLAGGTTFCSPGLSRSSCLELQPSWATLGSWSAAAVGRGSHPPPGR